MEPMDYNTPGQYRVHYFQRPISPVAAAATPCLASGQDYFSASTRKRQRPDSAHSREGRHTQQTTAWSWEETPRWPQCPTPSDNLFGSGQGSALVNERYRLADGFDTPGVQSICRPELLPGQEDPVRRRLRDDDSDVTMRSGCTPLTGPLACERNGVARGRPASDKHIQTTWTSLACNIIAKALKFGSTAFRGFSAGGGKGYSPSLQPSQEVVSPPEPSRHGTEIDFFGDFEQDSPHFNHGSPSGPAVKRRQTDRDSWIMVDMDSRSSSPRRKSSIGALPRSSLASRASSRRSLAPVSRKAMSNHQSNVTTAQTVATPPRPQSRRASIAHTRSPQGRPRSSGGAPTLVSPEAERFAKRQTKQAKTMTSMSTRIQEMMREAQEALGTKYSVESDYDGMEDEDEGFVDDEW